MVDARVLGGVLSQELAGQALIAVWEGRAAPSAARPSQTAIKLVRGGEQGHLLRSSTGCEVVGIGDNTNAEGVESLRTALVTLVEAFAEAYGLDAHGGRARRKYGNERPKTPLGEIVRLESTVEGARIRRAPRQKRKGYFLRAETAFGFMEVVSGMRGYWDEDTAQMSHGEGFLTVFSAMFLEPGLYLMDEPDAALSFTSCLQLVALIQKLGQSGAQVVCATHSPLLAATPGADIVEIGEEGLRRTTWDKLELVDHWRRYLHDPNSYLRHVTDS